MQAAHQLLDIQRVDTVHGGTSVYGVSYAAIRSVASGGKVCLVALDVKGAETLYHDERIDAAFVYVLAPTFSELECRVRRRPREAESTVQKRLAWAAAEVRRACCTRLMHRRACCATCVLHHAAVANARTVDGVQPEQPAERPLHAPLLA
jgi:guanylate kinase